MRGLKLIAVFILLIGFTYLGVVFVEANREEVILEIGKYRTNPSALGFVVMSSTLIGLVLGALLGSFEILSLLMQNQNLKKRLRKFEQAEIMGNTLPEVAPPPSSDPMMDGNPKAFSIHENLP
jgi:uncharacterized integral membrane protein